MIKKRGWATLAEVKEMHESVMFEKKGKDKQREVEREAARELERANKKGKV